MKRVFSRSSTRGHLSILSATCALFGARSASATAPDGQLVQFNDNGFWCWFQDERAVIDPATDQLLIGSVASGDGAGGAARDGNDDVVSYNLNTSAIRRFTLTNFSYLADDHFAPALSIRPDGRYLAMYCAHQNDSLIRWRVSTNPGDISSWGPEQTLTVTSNQGTTYSNLYYLSSTGKTYDFYRGNNYDPHMLTSSNDGASWNYTGHLLMDPGNGSGVRPYVKYVSNGVDKIYFTSTQTHPRDSNTGIYAGYITPADGTIHRIDGTMVGTLGTNSGTAVSVTALNTIFAAQPEGVIGNRTHFWTTDLALDSSGSPYALMTSRTETDTTTSTADTSDHRFYYGRWNGHSFDTHEIAKAGGYLYSSEQDYTGLGALSPSDPNTLYISTKIDPRDGATTTSKYEIYRGFTTNTGATWTWIPITTGSTVDNLRPIVPSWDDTHTALLWFKGTYTTYQHVNAAVVGKFYTGNNGAWMNPSGGVWGTNTSWMENRIADGMSFIGDFSSLDISGAVNVTSSGQRSIGFLTFGDTNPATPGDWNLSGGTIVLDGGAVAATITVTSQSAIIASILSGSQGLTKNGPGTLVLASFNDYTGPTIVNEGTLIAKRLINTALTINFGTVQVQSASEISSLAMAQRSVLDLKNNSLLIDNATLDDVRNLLFSRRLTSSLSGGGFALGYQANGGAVMIDYVYAGDANLDDAVNALDFNVLASNFGESSQFWDAGDFNYDGVVDTLDFQMLAGNFNRALLSSAATLAPEPSVALLLGLLPMHKRRRLSDRDSSRPRAVR